MGFSLDRNTKIYGGMGVTTFGFFLTKINFYVGVGLAIIGVMLFLSTNPMIKKDDNKVKRVREFSEDEVVKE